MRPVLVVALLGLGLFGAGISGVGRVDQQVAQADKAARQATHTRTVDCPWRTQRQDAEHL